MVYANSGEKWDAATHTWHLDSSCSKDLVVYAKEWMEHGVQVIGGCCRIYSKDIGALHEMLQAAHLR